MPIGSADANRCKRSINLPRTLRKAPPPALMLVLFDNGMPRTLARFLIDHHMVTEAHARGWAELENRKLLDEGEAQALRC